MQAARQGLVTPLVLQGSICRAGVRDFLAFATPSDTRFALHVENKMAAPFQAFQPESYPLRAAHMRFNRWVPYEDYATVLIAPMRYLEKNGDSCAPFDVIISHEEIRTMLPHFN